MAGGEDENSKRPEKDQGEATVRLPNGAPDVPPSGADARAAAPSAPAAEDRARDAALMARVAAKDGAAMRALWDAYRLRVGRLALRLMKDEDEARAVTLDAFAQLWESAAEWEPRGRVLAWLLVTAKNLALTRLGQRARFVTIEDDDAPRDAAPAGARATRLADEGFVAPSPMEVLEDFREGLVVRAALAELPAAQRRAVELRYFGGLTTEDAARREHVPLDTMYSRTRLALEKLGHRLEAIERRRRREAGEGPPRAGEREEAEEDT